MFFSQQGINFSITLQQIIDTTIDFTLGAIRGGFITPNGKQLLVIAPEPTDVWHYYNLSTAWDLSTKTYIGTKACPDSSPFGTFLDPTGTKGGNISSNNRFRAVSLTVPYSFTTTTYLGFAGGTLTGTYPRNPKWNADGSKLFSNNQSGPDYFIERTLTTNYDIQTINATYGVTPSFSCVDWDFINSGNYIVVAPIGSTSLEIRALSTAYDPTTYGPVLATIGSLSIYNIQVIDSEGIIFIYNNGNIYKYSYTL